MHSFFILKDNAFQVASTHVNSCNKFVDVSLCHLNSMHIFIISIRLKVRLRILKYWIYIIKFSNIFMYLPIKNGVW